MTIRSFYRDDQLQSKGINCHDPYFREQVIRAYCPNIYIVCLYAGPSKVVDTRSVCLNTSPISEKPKPPDAFQRPNTTLWFHGVMSANRKWSHFDELN